jgi:hypothetical protein
LEQEGGEVTAPSSRRSGNEFAIPQRPEEIEKRVLARLVFEEAQPPALRHIGDDLDRAAKIGIRVPWRSQTIEIGLRQVMLRGHVHP